MSCVAIRFREVAVITVMLPLVAAVTCVLLAATHHGHLSTRTHCEVRNVLPSISAAIGDYTPERYVWRLLISLHAAPRFLVAHMYHRRYQDRLYKPGTLPRLLSRYAVLPLQYGELLALLTMSYVSSSENFDLHEAAFVVFVLASLAYMLTSLYLSAIIIRTSYSRPDVSEQMGMTYKKCAVAANCVALALAVYLYWRHNAYCEPYVYSMFAACEYVVVLSNIAFHFTAYWDFPHHSLYATDYDIAKHS